MLMQDNGLNREQGLQAILGGQSGKRPQDRVDLGWVLPVEHTCSHELLEKMRGERNIRNAEAVAEPLLPLTKRPLLGFRHDARRTNREMRAGDRPKLPHT